ncbi:unnamed protein product [Paramecium sonneborni]|uniref:Hypoxanthine phosphoribosyltransferase n=1 Tax=Paramecium sonneborni TaxID=65129 RepID=A0A8S1K041_9CILI|nr:unnamed protein product [Paramecium sonneborni]CAD8045628.1 unnamed protein product [Paramecium sonneborni]CAD8045629.1 unnamed protein product [Paramecium sonneborni]
MNLIIKDKELQLYYSKEQLKNMVGKTANQISNDYQDKHPIFIGVLNGAFMFMSDLIRAIDPQLKFQIDFIKLSSYEGSKSTGIVKALSGLKNDIKGRNVIVVEDIIETGLTITAVIEEMKKLEPATIKLCACFLKTGKQKINIKPDYLCTEIEDKFIIGYGLDWDEFGRGLDQLYYIQ